MDPQKRTIDTMVFDAIVKNQTFTITQIAEMLGTSKSTVNRAISRLKAAGRIERAGGKRNGKWSICK